MWKLLKGIALSLLAAMLVVGCGGGDDKEKEKEKEKTEENSKKEEEKKEGSDTAAKEEEKSPEEKKENPEGLGVVGNYGKVTVISEAPPFTLEGNENVTYVLSDLKLVKIEEFSEEGKSQIAWGTGTENMDDLPYSVYAVIGKETKKNNTDMSIEFTGVHTMAADSQQIDVITHDFTTEDNEGSTMLGGVKQESQFAVIVDSPDVKTLKFVLSQAFDSETFENTLLEEQQIERELTS